jgi:futalosine hydrolase
MQILLVAATSMEIAPFLQARPAADFLITGVGSPSAIYHLTKRLHQIDYDLVIQAGIAGSFDASIPLGQVILVKEDRFADIGISEKNNFYTSFETGLSDENMFPFKHGWLKNEHEFVSSFLLEKFSAITVNTVTDDQMQIKMLKSKFLPQLESMEGAALHYVCLQENIPFIQLRSISNYVGERDKTKWKMKEAIENLNVELSVIVEKLTVL